MSPLPQAPGPTRTFEVELPGGGKLQLLSAEEVAMWNDAMAAYKADYGLSKANDLMLLGSLLIQQLAMFRAQQHINGMKPQLDESGVPTGRYEQVAVKPSEVSAASEQIRRASKEIREIEGVLGIDKKNREAGGKQTVGEYARLLKEAAHQYGVHIAERTKAYEKFAMALRTKLRILYNADDEDRHYEGVSEEKILEWASNELAKLEEVDKKYAKQKGKVFVGKL